MAIKRKELYVFAIFFMLVLLRLGSIKWADPLLYASFSLLVFTWIYGFAKRNGAGVNGFSGLEFTERMVSLVFITGLMLNVTETRYSRMFLVFGLFLISVFQLVKGIVTLVQSNEVGMESIVVSVICFGYFLRLMSWPGSGPLRVMSMTVLFMLYVGLGILFYFRMKEKGHPTASAAGMLLYWSAGLHVFAILFDSMSWPGQGVIFYVALLSSTLLALLFLNTTKSISTDKDVLSMYKRIVLVTSISIFFWVATEAQYLRFRYGIRPQLIAAYIHCLLHPPADESAKIKYCNEFDRLDQLARNGNYPEGSVVNDGDSLAPAGR